MPAASVRTSWNLLRDGKVVDGRNPRNFTDNLNDIAAGRKVVAT